MFVLHLAFPLFFPQLMESKENLDVLKKWMVVCNLFTQLIDSSFF